ncbi:UNVERIFIED_CONTAM: nitrate ABC transporter substrate-binding protein [Mumia flava]
MAALTLALTLSATATACGGDDASAGDGSGDDTTAVTVGVIPILDVAPIYLGVEQGFFADEGLDVTLETAQGGAAIVPGVVSGQFQFGFSNTISLLLATSEGLPLTVVADGVSSTGEEGNDFGAVIVPADSDIKTAADLEGKKVAVNTLNNINTTTTNEAVRKDGGDPSTIEYVELAFPDIIPAIQKGDVDAGQVVEPFLTIGTSSGMRAVTDNFVQTDPDLTVAMYFTSEQFAQEDPEVVEAFTSAMNESLDYAQENPDAVREVLGTYTELDADLQEQVILPRWTSEIDVDSVELLSELAVTDGLYSEQPDIDTLLP